MTRYSLKTGLNIFLKAAGITPYLYHRELPQDPSYPATVYDIVSDINTCHTHDRVNGPRQARVQIDVYAETVAAAEDAMEQYVELFTSYSGDLGAGFLDVAIFDEGANPDLDFESEPTLRHLEGRSRDFMILY
jgi:hypothetical protein